MAGTINTSAVLNNGWNSGSNDTVFSGTIAINPMLEKVYDYVLTSDPVLLQERKRTQEIIYDIFVASPYFEKYGGRTSDPSIFYTKKIERSDIIDVFYYTKERLEQLQKISIMEIVIGICEFYELDYKHVIDNVLSVPLQAKLIQEVAAEGHNKKKIENCERLF